ncbi:kynureninase [Friedmanniella endophytica]|uniref:Kynureninase n=1 Tax=Microlunatus kandeliicorticis TaxID=1759536 RepID=A0A7W3IT64_9ACTN|nr:aminotransferase class V-fold PLP-dependent enzyme [Microlunatus kandeliicorticis]MBA8794710.1 kynureninase [Microlunatus kandeliicorticis]
MTDFAATAADLDAADPLGHWPGRFVPAGDDLVAYLDGNSLGRPPRDLPAALDAFVRGPWADRLIRGWSEGDEPWMDWPLLVGDELAAAALGAAAGQTIIADSTSVLIYKLARAALSLSGPERDEIVLDAHNFPTDRYLLEGIAAETGRVLRWIETDPELGVTPELVAEVVGERTALVLASHVAYRSGYLAEAAAITAVAHDAGAPVLWDCSHSVGSVPIMLDAWEVDFAVGCGYKYLNGGPGAPAFGYVAARHHDHARQPLQGWMGHAEPFVMGPGYRPAAGIRGFVTGTPPILAMVPLRLGIGDVAEAGIEAVRTKSLALTDFALSMIDELLVPRGVRLGSPRDHDHRGGHLTISRTGFEELTPRLWARGVIPDFRRPDGIRLGLSPLTTRFAEVARAIEVVVEELDRV